MALTEVQKAETIAVLDAQIPKRQYKKDGRYKQVWPTDIEVLGVTYTTRMDEYVGPKGVGFIRIIERHEGNMVHRYSDHNGPEDITSGWTSYDKTRTI